MKKYQSMVLPTELRTRGKTRGVWDIGGIGGNDTRDDQRFEHGMGRWCVEWSVDECGECIDARYAYFFTFANI